MPSWHRNKTIEFNDERYTCLWRERLSFGDCNTLNLPNRVRQLLPWEPILKPVLLLKHGRGRLTEIAIMKSMDQD